VIPPKIVLRNQKSKRVKEIFMEVLELDLISKDVEETK
jgi:hypothetical protein